MPNITQVGLTLQHGGPGTGIPAQRTARVTFTTSFSQIEAAAGVVFKADIKLVSKDSINDDRILNVGSRFVQAQSTPVQTSISRIFTRGNLDEDSDVTILHNGGLDISEDRDEWTARVTMSPAVFGTATGNSDLVTGSWGAVGAD